MLCDRSLYFVKNNLVAIFILRGFLRRRIMVKISLTTQDNGKPFPAEPLSAINKENRYGKRKENRKS